MKSLFVFAVYAAITVPLHASSLAQAKVSPSGLSELEATLASHNVEVRLWTKEVEIGKSGFPPEVSQNSCTYSRIPCSLVEAIQLKIDGTSIFVPRSIFADLSDLADVQMKATLRGFVITADGGDASAAYSVKIETEFGRVVKRTLSGYHDFEHPLQVTTYYDVVLN